jgi:hypothetical protein
LVLAFVIGAAIGALLVAPAGGVVVDGGPGCTDCGQWTVILIGMRVSDPYPRWLPLVAAAIGGTVFLLIVLLSRPKRRRSRGIDPSRT